MLVNTAPAWIVLRVAAGDVFAAEIRAVDSPANLRAGRSGWFPVAGVFASPGDFSRLTGLKLPAKLSVFDAAEKFAGWGVPPELDSVAERADPGGALDAWLEAVA